MLSSIPSIFRSKKAVFLRRTILPGPMSHMLVNRVLRMSVYVVKLAIYRPFLTRQKINKPRPFLSRFPTQFVPLMLSVLQVGEVRVAEDSDFRKLKTLSDETDDWKLEYQKNGTNVWTKNNTNSSFKIVKVRSVFDDVSAEELYDVLLDPEYRKMWDHSMLEGYEICAINPNNDIGYYALRSPPPLRNRDFVTQRSWLDMGKEKCILNHSVNHESCPPKKGFIRGISYMTGYLIRTIDDRRCQFTYVAQSDPKGKLPVWVVNKATKSLAPKVITRIYKACKSYPSWKCQHNPHLKPWLYPEQMTLPRLNMSQIKPITAGISSESIDESGLTEEECDSEEYCNY